MESERIIGQNHIIKHFENAIKMGKISHAYIINGEEGSGKLKLAVHFAKALQCEKNRRDEDNNLQFDFFSNSDADSTIEVASKDSGADTADIGFDEYRVLEAKNNDNVSGEACGECHSCRQTDSGNQPDIKYITHEKAGIGIDEIREQINDDIDIKPYSSKYKIYIVPESEKMTIQAQNALLKTIEEPPEYAIIILLTTNADKFLQTILSRCVLLNIKPVKEEIIKNQLTSEYGVSDYEAKVAATFSGGNPGKAIRLATSEDFKELKGKVTQTVTTLQKGGMDVISESIKTAAEFKKQIGEYFSLLRIWFRDMLMYKATGNSENLIFQDDYMTIEKMAQDCSYFSMDVILKAIDQAESRINSNVNFDTTMEVLFLTIKERIQK